MWMLLSAASIPGQPGDIVEACHQIFTQLSTGVNAEAALRIVPFAGGISIRSS